MYTGLFSDGMFKGIYNGKQCHAADIPTVLRRAWNAGVERIIVALFVDKVTGGSFEESKEALAIAETDGASSKWRNSFIQCKISFLTMQGDSSVRNSKKVAIPKGISRRLYHWPKKELKKERYFEKQFELAEAVKLPMFLHMRAAAADFCEIFARNKARLVAGVAHSFTGSAEDLDKLLAFNNLFIGINGCSLKTAENLDVLKGVPIGRMMIETDSPYCEIKNTHAGINFVKSVWPSKKKEKYAEDCTVKGRNEPCMVRQVLEVVAGCKGVADIDQLSKTLYHNTCSWVGLRLWATSSEVQPDLLSTCHDVTYIHTCLHVRKRLPGGLSGAFLREIVVSGNLSPLPSAMFRKKGLLSLTSRNGRLRSLLKTAPLHSSTNCG
ncbi:hypothetical protein ACLOJK_032701 [Asimina triloba]